MDKIAIFSPINPIKSGISHHVESLLPYLSKYFQIDLYLDKGIKEKSNFSCDNVNLFTYEENNFNPKIYKDIIYHMGNNFKNHGYFRSAMKEYPGIIVLHDYVLRGYYGYLKKINRQEYKKIEQKYCRQKDSNDRRNNFILNDKDALNNPLNEEILNISKKIVVHSDFCKRLIENNNPNLKVTHIPLHLVNLKNSSISKEEARKELNITNDEIVILSLGFITENKRFPVIIPIINELQGYNFKYIIIGEDKENILKDILDNSMKNIKFKGYLPLNAMEKYIIASDFCINLRYPTMGESSGSLLRLMSQGKTVIVSDCGSYKDFPFYTLIKIDTEVLEKDMLKEAIKSLIKNKDLVYSIGKEAHRYVNKYCSLEKCAELYFRLITKP